MKINRCVLWPVLGILALWLQTVTASAVIFTTNTSISFNNTNYDGQDIVVIGCTVTVDGSHTFADVLLLDGGKLTHSFAANGVFPNPIAAINELQTLSGINFYALDNTNVNVSSIIVTDTNFTIIYAAGTDYVISSNGVTDQFLIARTPTSTIPDGATVFLNYTWLGTPVNAGLNLTVSNNLVVEAGSAIDVAGLGYGGGSGPGAGSAPSVPMVGGGGGGYGGSGGSSPGVAAGGNSYGLTTTPANLGSGGGTDFSDGAPGGGAVKLVVGGAIWVDGQIVADGADGLGGGSGGGAGGSVWLSSATIGGAGTISANGGAGEPFDGGGGGGGRIAVYYGSSEFAGNFTAHGGMGVTAGGAGTIYTRLTGNPAGQALVDNAGLSGANTTVIGTEAFDLTIIGGAAVIPTPGGVDPTVGNLFIGSNSWMTVRITTPISFSQELLLSVKSNATIQSGGGIMLDGKGNPAGQGPGAGATRTTNNIQIGTGGGYGGFGGLTTGVVGGPIAPGGLTYGPYAGSPIEFGSGGGLAPGTPYNMGGSGGGLLGMNVTGTLTLNGVITANGNPGIGSTGGGGSGGGIAFSVGTLAGTGNITANGGAGDLPYGGGGGGGRIAISITNNTFTGVISARGGPGAQAGGAGTIYIQSGTGTPSLVIDNGGQSGASTPVPASSGQPLFDLTISGGTVGLTPSSTPLSVRNLLIASNSSLTYMPASPAQTVVQLSASGNATIQPGGSILGDGLGSPANQGQGKGGTANIITPVTSTTGGGGGYGGNGGAGASGAPGGAGYGTIFQPINPGSGGGGSQQIILQPALGGAGGGALEITVTGTLTVNGRISANGSNAIGQGSGGGSGGSVWLTAGTFSGTGAVSANGGAGDFPNGGGGGGGRIAIISGTNQFTGAISVLGGQGFVNGGAGTLYTRLFNAQVGTVLVDGGGSSGATTLLGQMPTSDVTITGGATVAGNSGAGIRNLVINSNSSFILNSQPAQSGLLTITGDVTVQSGGSINANGQGFAANSGTGAGAFLTSTSFGGTGSGGSYGGNGGAGASGASTLGAYGQILEPQNPGSGGGTGTGTNLGAAGGGAIHMSVKGTFTLNGTLSANGAIPNFPAGGGGSGGSIWLSVGTLTGSGLISANGASGDLPYGGGGGGGRVAVIANTYHFDGNVTAQGGPGFANGGAGTVDLQGPDSQPGLVTIDNGGLVGTNTPLLTSGSFSLNITGGALVTPPAGAGVMMVSNLLVDTGGVLTQFTPGQGNVSLNVNGNAMIGPTGGIVVDGDGFSGGAGNGAGSMTNLNSGGSGGGYGGAGGASASGTPGGATYGSVQQPTLLGSPGGVLPIVTNLSAGGGTIRLTATGTLTVNGRISANGRAGMFDYGGGSGGSIWLTAGAISGNGVISANGGAGEPFAGGGGGGGRIAIYSGTNVYTGITTVAGGIGVNNGQVGTIYLSAQFIVSGIVMDMNSVPLSGISLQSADGSASASTDANGNYSMAVPKGWSGTVGPSLPAALFTPAQYSYNNVTEAMVNQNFVMVPPPFALSNLGTGTSLNLGWFGTNGVNYQVLSSSNLVDWLPYGSPITGTGGMISLPIPTTDAPQMFFKLSTGD